MCYEVLSHETTHKSFCLHLQECLVTVKIVCNCAAIFVLLTDIHAHKQDSVVSLNGSCIVSVYPFENFF